MEEERPFNFAQLLLERCNKLFIRAHEFSSEGDPIYWYRVLGALKRAISFVLEDKEYEELNKKLSLVNVKIKNKKKQNQEMFYFDIEKTLDETETLIVKLMYKYELYYPHYSKKTWQEKAKYEEDI